MLQVLNDKGIELLILSQSAFNCLHTSQINQLEKICSACGSKYTYH